MMKDKFLLIAFLLISFSGHLCAQENPEPYNGTMYGEGATKTTKVTTDEKLNKTVTVTIRDKDNNICQVDTWINSVDGKWTLESKVLTIGGNTICKDTYTIDENGNVTRYETSYKGYEKEIYVRSSEGDLLSIKDGEVFPFQEQLKNDIKAGLNEMEKKSAPSMEPRQTSCSMMKGGNCPSVSQLFGGYSYLNSSFGNTSENFPIGVHASFVYNLSAHVGIGADASYHTKKVYEETLVRLFVLATAKYTFGNVKNCSRMFIPDLHILAGLGTEKYGSSDGSGFALGGGGGMDIKICRNMAIRTQADFIAVKFGGTEDWNNNFRASVGMIFYFQAAGSAPGKRF